MQTTFLIKGLTHAMEKTKVHNILTLLKDLSIKEQNLNTMNPKVCNRCMMCLNKDDTLDLMVHNLMHWISIPTIEEILPGAEIIDNNDVQPYVFETVYQCLKHFIYV